MSVTTDSKIPTAGFRAFASYSSQSSSLRIDYTINGLKNELFVGAVTEEPEVQWLKAVLHLELRRNAKACSDDNAVDATLCTLDLHIDMAGKIENLRAAVGDASTLIGELAWSPTNSALIDALLSIQADALLPYHFVLASDFTKITFGWRLSHCQC